MRVAVLTRSSTLPFFMLWAALLTTPSRGFASSHLIQPCSSRATIHVSSPKLEGVVGGYVPTISLPSLGQEYPPRPRHCGLLPGCSSFRSRRLVEAVSTLRGGSEMAAAGGLGAVSVTGGVALFIQGVLLSMVISLDGFRVREHFVSYGYGFSVALQAAAAAWLFRERLHTLSALHAAGLVAYGLRLVIFCRWRDSLACFRERKRRQIQQTPTAGRPYSFWLICSVLYALLALPTVYVQRRLPAPEGWLGVSQAGLATMAVGLLVEGVADWQKSKFKMKERDNFISSGLFRYSRHANYFGELVFWAGAWLAAIPSFTEWYHWVLASLGTIQIFAIIVRATGGLEKRQVEKYGSSNDWKAYAALTPVLVPFTRQYTRGKRSSQ